LPGKHAQRLKYSPEFLGRKTPLAAKWRHVKKMLEKLSPKHGQAQKIGDALRELFETEVDCVVCMERVCPPEP